MAVITRRIPIETKGDADIIDVTDQVALALHGSGLSDGIVTLFCQSATSALTTIEYESGALSDLKRLFDEVADPSRHYQHNARWGDGNGHSHVRAALLKPSLTIPFTQQRMTLGTWQQIVLVDFDNRPRHRDLVVQILGE